MLKNKKEDNLTEWYNELLLKANLIDNSIVQGCIVYKDYCLKIWEEIKKIINKKLTNLGFEQSYFPMLIPLSSFKKEKRHYNDLFRETVTASGFGDSKFDETFLIRPTSEAIIYESFSKWVEKEEDLPILINQYCSVMRWESLKPNLPLIRGNEFLWQESHSVHSTEKETDSYAEKVLNIYKKLLEDCLAIPFIEGFKPNHRMFPGAKYTLALECLMPDLKSVQIATSHSLGQNFSSVFDIKFKDKDGNKKTVWQACNGITTRVIGAMVMMHSDDKGLIIPPKISPMQCIFINKIDEDIKERLINKKVRFIEDKEEKSEKEKIDYYTLIGAPLIIKNDFILIRRDNNEEIKTDKENLIGSINKNLDMMQKEIFEKAKRFMQNNTSSAGNLEDFKKVAEIKGGFIKSYWCGNVDCAKSIKKETKNSLRVVNPVKEENKKCVFCNKEAGYLGFFAPAY